MFNHQIGVSSRISERSEGLCRCVQYAGELPGRLSRESHDIRHIRVFHRGVDGKRRAWGSAPGVQSNTAVELSQKAFSLQNAVCDPCVRSRGFKISRETVEAPSLSREVSHENTRGKLGRAQ